MDNNGGARDLAVETLKLLVTFSLGLAGAAGLIARFSVSVVACWLAISSLVFLFGVFFLVGIAFLRLIADYREKEPEGIECTHFRRLYIASWLVCGIGTTLVLISMITSLTVAPPTRTAEQSAAADGASPRS